MKITLKSNKCLHLDLFDKVEIAKDTDEIDVYLIVQINCYYFHQTPTYEYYFEDVDEFTKRNTIKKKRPTQEELIEQEKPARNRDWSDGDRCW